MNHRGTENTEQERFSDYKATKTQHVFALKPSVSLWLTF